MKCPTCWVHPRLPFFICNKGHVVCQECKAHLNIREESELPAGTAACQNTEKEAVLLNKFIKCRDGAKEVCQYGCGIYGFTNQLGRHEAECGKSSNRGECLIGNCQWKGYTKELIEHVKGQHSNHLRDLSSLKTAHFSIKPDKSPWLVIVHNEHSTSNQVFWVIMKQIQEQRCIAVIRHGFFGCVEAYIPFAKFNVYLTSYFKDLVGDIIPYKLNLRNHLKDDKFLLEQGMTLALSVNTEFRITIAPEYPTKTLPEQDIDMSQQEDWKMNVNARNIRTYAESGCMICALCPWKGGSIDLRNHCNENHNFVTLDQFNPVKIEGTSFNSVSFLSSECFIMKINLTREIKFTVFHITEELSSKYFAEVRYLNTDNNFIVQYTFPCQPVAARDFKKNSLKSWKNYHSFSKTLVEKLKTDDDKLMISFNIVTHFVTNIEPNETIRN